MKKSLVAFICVMSLIISSLSTLSFAQDSIVVQKNFVDVQPDFWAQDAINWAIQKGVVSGYKDGTFKPNKSVSRAEFATMMVLGLDLPISNLENSSFVDISKEYWGYKYIQTAKPFLTGFETSKGEYFKPSEPSKREDVAVALVKALKLENENANDRILNRFIDEENISENLKKYIAIAVEHKIMAGGTVPNSDLKEFNGKSYLTRAQAVVLLFNTVQQMKADLNKEKKVEITFWEQDDQKTVGPVWEKIINDFQTNNPGITVTRTHLYAEYLRINYQNAVNIGEGPSVISCSDDNIGIFGIAKTAMELDGVFSKDFLATLDLKAVEAEKFNGKLYGIPYHVGNSLALLYNKKLVSKAPETMDELVTTALKLTKSPDQYGLVYDIIEPFFNIPFLGGFGGNVLDDKGNITLDTDAMKKTVNLVYDLTNKYKITPSEANYDVANNLFKEGKAAFIINGPWSYQEYKSAGIDLGIAKLPKTTDGKYPTPYTSSKVLILNSNLKDAEKDATIKFVEFINTKENQLEIAKATEEFPTNLEAAKDSYFTDNSELKALADQMTVAIPMPIDMKMRAVWDGVRPVFMDVMSGKIKPEDAPKKMQELAEGKAKAMLQWE